MKLQRDIVVQTALDLLNEVGVDGLTTRRLAERLGVQQPALYWHFKNKRALLDAMAEAMLVGRHPHSLPGQAEPWRTFLARNARSFRQALLAYRDGARIHAGTRPSGSQSSRVAEAQIRFLHDAGFSLTDAAYALIAISHYTVGAVLEQQAYAGDARDRLDAGEGARLPPLLDELLAHFHSAGPEAAFDYGLGVILDGLEGKCTPPHRRSRRVTPVRPRSRA
ncbi:MAG TPA: tetracycline resistance transcriptional repressor TetR [Vineibacter sp.]|nr:tetracycline resistance transcriptional repressor TetR [Vineibacter sp.]